MTDVNKTIRYTFELVDNVSATGQRMENSARDAGQKLDELNTKQEQTRTEAAKTGAALQSQQLSIVTQLTALMGFREATSAITGGVIGLGLASDETAVALNKINAAFSIFAGFVTVLKSMEAVMTTLNVATAVNGALTAFTATLKNPAALATVGLAAGAAAGVAGALLMTTNNNSTNTTNIQVTDTTPKDLSEAITIVNGGAL